MNRFTEVRDLIMSMEADFHKFYGKRNKAAGTRVRKGMQDLKSLAQDIRISIQDTKNGNISTTAKLPAKTSGLKALKASAKR